ncbi:resolvase [Leptolyngbyaceae cyanobacterium UHCC 1019]
MDFEVGTKQSGLMDIEAVQRALNRSRASVYRYANTDAMNPNPSYDAKRLNPEFRKDENDLLLFHPNEVARFAKDVLRIKQVTIEVREMPKNQIQEVLEAILVELQAIHHCLKGRS